MDDDTRKAALRALTYGLYVVGARAGDEINAMTATWVTQVSFEPPLLAVRRPARAGTDGRDDGARRGLGGCEGGGR